MQKKNLPFHHLGVFLLLLVLVFFVQYLGAFFMTPALHEWYQGLQKPTWTPRQEVFFPIWTFLYIIVAGVAYFLWKEKPSVNRKHALVLWGLQLVANAFWSFFFFRLQQVGLALLDLFLILVLVFWLFHYAKKVSKAASVLLLPYIIWLVYAFFLNVNIWWHN